MDNDHDLLPSDSEAADAADISTDQVNVVLGAVSSPTPAPTPVTTPTPTPTPTPTASASARALTPAPASEPEPDPEPKAAPAPAPTTTAITTTTTSDTTILATAEKAQDGNRTEDCNFLAMLQLAPRNSIDSSSPSAAATPPKVLSTADAQKIVANLAASDVFKLQVCRRIEVLLYIETFS